MSGDTELLNRLKRHGVPLDVTTTLLASKKFTNSDLDDRAIESLASLKPHDAIDIIKDISFPPYIMNKSKLLCSYINKSKKTCREENKPGEKERAYGWKGQGRWKQPNASVFHRSNFATPAEPVQDLEDTVDENKLFTYLVKSCDGFIGMKELSKKCDLIPDAVDMFKWFQNHRRKFKLFVRHGKILYVSAYHKEVTLCLSYNGLFGRSKLCKKTNCEHFHICKDYISGNCLFGKKCSFSHSFQDAWNNEHKKDLNLSQFSNKDMVIILRNRYPTICSEFLKRTTCSVGADCPNLHLCSLNLKRKCPRGEDCPRGHSYQTDHNMWVLRSFEVSSWLNGNRQVLLNKTILVDKSLEAKVEDGAIEDSKIPDATFTVDHMERIEKTNSREDSVIPHPLLSEERSDNADRKFICSKFIEGKCQTPCSEGQHHLSHGVPYFWQIKRNNNWHCFSKQCNEKIENGFCQCEEVIDAEIVVDKTATCMVRVRIRNVEKLEGVVYKCDGEKLQIPERLPVRRLSTESYIVHNEKKLAVSPGFLTQWRWFWRDDFLVWLQFETDKLQRTLESKYKYGQPTYLFSRENYRFRYRIDFRTFRQVNLDTGKNRDLCRRPLFVSMENVRKKQYPVTLDTSDPLSKPPTFSPWDLSSEFEFVELEREKKEFKDVHDSFFATLDNTKFKILCIYRVQNWKLYNDYNQMKKKMQKDIEVPGQEVNEKFLFHGTDTIDTCRGICTNNFDFRTSGKNATVYGHGSYFATTAKYSHRYTRAGANDQRFMFRAKVLVGTYTKGNSSYRRPPERPGQTHKLYDSCVDDEVKPSMYIIFERSQSYPEYLITYKESIKYDISGASSVSDSYASVTSSTKPASVVSHVSMRPRHIQPVSYTPPASHVLVPSPSAPTVSSSPIVSSPPPPAPSRPADWIMKLDQFRQEAKDFIERIPIGEKKKDEKCVLQ